MNEEKCDQKSELLVRTASHAYFGQVVSALRLPDPAPDPLRLRLRGKDVWSSVIVFGDADEGLALRRQGWVVRDTVLVLLPGPQALQAFVVRQTGTNLNESIRGAMNIDACRGGPGRWPPNVLLVHAPACVNVCARGCPVQLLDEQTGILTSGRVEKGYKRHANKNWSGGWQRDHPLTGYGDSGRGSRFFPVFRDLAAAQSWLEALLRMPATTLAVPL